LYIIDLKDITQSFYMNQRINDVEQVHTSIAREHSTSHPTLSKWHSECYPRGLISFHYQKVSFIILGNVFFIQIFFLFFRIFFFSGYMMNEITVAVGTLRGGVLGKILITPLA